MTGARPPRYQQDRIQSASPPAYDKGDRSFRSRGMQEQRATPGRGDYGRGYGKPRAYEDRALPPRGEDSKFSQTLEDGRREQPRTYGGARKNVNFNDGERRQQVSQRNGYRKSSASPDELPPKRHYERPARDGSGERRGGRGGMRGGRGGRGTGHFNGPPRSYKPRGTSPKDLSPDEKQVKSPESVEASSALVQ